MKNERYVEIVTPSYTYKGRMTIHELLKEARDRVLRPDDVTIAGLVMYGWDEVDMMWAITSDNPDGEEERKALEAHLKGEVIG